MAKLARSEFDSAVAALRDKGVSVKVFNDVEDRYDQHTGKLVRRAASDALVMFFIVFIDLRLRLREL